MNSSINSQQKRENVNPLHREEPPFSAKIKNLPVLTSPSVSYKKTSAKTPSLSPIRNLVESMGFDFDVVLLLFLLYVLIQEKADRFLIFALLYILL